MLINESVPSRRHYLPLVAHQKDTKTPRCYVTSDSFQPQVPPPPAGLNRVSNLKSLGRCHERQALHRIEWLSVDRRANSKGGQCFTNLQLDTSPLPKYDGGFSLSARCVCHCCVCHCCVCSAVSRSNLHVVSLYLLAVASGSMIQRVRWARVLTSIWDCIFHRPFTHSR